MKKLLILFVLVFGASQMNAQTAKKRSTGDSEFDAGFDVVMKYARKNAANFKSYIAGKYTVTETWTGEQLTKVNGADLMMILETAKNSGKTTDELISYFNANRNTKDWEAMFKDLGIKAGSEIYEKIKTALINNGLN